jgi:hypothetical protein
MRRCDTFRVGVGELRDRLVGEGLCLLLRGRLTRLLAEVGVVVLEPLAVELGRGGTRRFL